MNRGKSPQATRRSVKSFAATGIAVTLLMLSSSAFPQSVTGYYAERLANDYANIPAGIAGNPGPAVTIVQKTVEAGNYLITARVDGQSYAPNSGAICFFTFNGSQFGYRTLNTSSNWSDLKAVNTVMLGSHAAVGSTVVTLTCQRGYSFTGASQFGAQLILVPVEVVQ